MASASQTIISYPSFDNIHRAITGAHVLPMTVPNYIATEKKDGSNIGVYFNLSTKRIERIYSRGNGAAGPILVWKDGDEDLADFKFCGHVPFFKKTNCELITNFLGLAHRVTTEADIEIPLVIVFGEACGNGFYPFALATLEGDFCQMSLALHKMILDSGLTPPRLLLEKPATIPNIVEAAFPELIRKPDVPPFEGWFITVDKFEFRSRTQGWKLKSNTHEEQPVNPINMDDFHARGLVIQRLQTLFDAKPVKVKKAKKENSEILLEIQAAFDSSIKELDVDLEQFNALATKEARIEMSRKLNPMMCKRLLSSGFEPESYVKYIQQSVGRHIGITLFNK